MSDQEEASPRYVVVVGERYEAERDHCAFQMSYAVGPDQATRWLLRLKQVTEDLADFPGPLAHAIDEEASVAFGREVRRLLYHGPSRRRSKQPARILFTLTPPASDDPNGETVIFLLRLLRGGQSLRGGEDEDARS